MVSVDTKVSYLGLANFHNVPHSSSYLYIGLYSSDWHSFKLQWKIYQICQNI